MLDLFWYQYLIIALTFIWSGFVRSGLGFGGSVFALPFLLMVVNDPLVWLPLISVHLLVFSSLTVYQNNKKSALTVANNHRATSNDAIAGTIDWKYLRYSLSIMIVPKLIGVLGLVTLAPKLLSSIIFVIIAAYSLTYILNKPFKSNNKALDIIFLMLGGYISGTSLIGAPLIIAVYANHVKREQLRDTLFVLWFILVTIKMATFIYVGINLQLIHHLWLLPCAAIGHIIGLHFHDKMLNTDPTVFYRYLGWLLLATSVLGIIHMFI